jgi:hypothetical protein
LSFTFSLCFDNGDEDLGGVLLNSYGMHTMVDNVAFFTLRLPTKALYRFIIYAKDTDMAVSLFIASHPLVLLLHRVA